MNRRSFLKAVGVAIVAPVVVCSSSPKKRPVEVYGRGPGIEAISDVGSLAVAKPKVADDGLRPKDGKYLDADEVECSICGRKIPILKGFYVRGDQIECRCGNKAHFVLFAKVSA